MEIPDRRQSQRVVLDKIRCIQLGLDNSAIVLNVSDGGLAFHAFQPIPDTGAIQFSFSLPNQQRVQATGELVWRDGSKKTAGLRFASLPAAMRLQIRDWVLQSSPVAPSAATPPASLNAPVAPVGPGIEGSGTSERFADAVSQAQPEPPRLPLLDELRARHAFDPLPPVEQRPTFLRGFLTGAAVSVLVMAVIFFAYGRQMNDALAQLRGSSGVKSDPEAVQVAGAQPTAPNPFPSSPSAVAPAPAPYSQQGESGAPVAPAASAPSAAVPNSSGTSLAGHGKQNRDLKGNGEPAGSISGDAETLGTRATQGTGDTGEKDLAIAQGYLRNRGSTGGSADGAVVFLWSAVGKGNVAAEVTLAEMYARGEGVARSCDQARVLLYAAASKGSDEADHQLAQIDRARCN
jgi:hypothetical protein